MKNPGYCPSRDAPLRQAAVSQRGRRLEIGRRGVRPFGAVEPLSLRRNFSWLAAGNAVDVLAQWGRVVLLAHLGSQAMIGTFALAFAVCAPLFALAGLGLRSVVMTDARGEYRFGDYLALRLATSVLAMLAVGGIVLAGPYDAETAWVILLAALGETFAATSDIVHGLMQQRERMDRIALSVSIRGLATLAALAVGVAATGRLAWAMAGYPLVAAALLLGYDLPGAARLLRRSAGGPEPLRPRWHAATMLRLAWLALPLAAVLTTIALSTSIPRYAIGARLGREALGIFVSIFYLAAVGSRVVAAVAQSAGPRLAKHHAAGDGPAFLALLGRLVLLAAALGAAAVGAVAIAGGPILRLLYRADFSAHARLAVLLMLAGAAMYLTVPLGMAVEALRRFKTHAAIRAAGILVLLALMPPWVRDYGLAGAAAALAVGFAATAAGCAAAVVLLVCADGRASRPASAPALAAEDR